MKSKMFWIGGVVVLLLAVGVTFAQANTTVTYYACVNNSSGTIHMIGENDTCNNNAMRIEWNQKGPKGDPGLPGADGAPGEPGADGADGSSCTATQGAGGVTITCEDGTEATLDDGSSCTITEDQGGGYVLSCDDGTTATINDGADGQDGADGPPGVDGAPGADGADGLHCWDLNWNSICEFATEDKNADGQCSALDCQGPEGPQGEQGPPGAEVLLCSEVTSGPCLITLEELAELEQRVSALEINPPLNYVFITENAYQGDFGSLEAADSICQAEASAAGLPGIYKAWLSDNTRSPSTRFVQSDQAYVLVTGLPVAADWTDLTDGYLVNPISVTASGSTLEEPPWNFAWTATKSDGTPSALSELYYDIYSCNEWTSSDSSDNGVSGTSHYSDSGWTELAAYNCSNMHHLYCFEQ